MRKTTRIHQFTVGPVSVEVEFLSDTSAHLRFKHANGRRHLRIYKGASRQGVLAAARNTARNVARTESRKARG